MSALSDISSAVQSVISDVSKSITELEDSLSENSYQSPLEVRGIAMREAMKPLQYYKKTYPYSFCNDNGYLRGNKAYTSISGWRPATTTLTNYVVDTEFENINNEFDIQTTLSDYSERADGITTLDDNEEYEYISKAAASKGTSTSSLNSNTTSINIDGNSINQMYNEVAYKISNSTSPSSQISKNIDTGWELDAAVTAVETENIQSKAAKALQESQSLLDGLTGNKINNYGISEASTASLEDIIANVNARMAD